MFDSMVSRRSLLGLASVAAVSLAACSTGVKTPGSGTSNNPEGGGPQELRVLEPEKN